MVDLFAGWPERTCSRGQFVPVICHEGIVDCRVDFGRWVVSLELDDLACASKLFHVHEGDHLLATLRESVISLMSTASSNSALDSGLEIAWKCFALFSSRRVVTFAVNVDSLR